MGRLHDSHAQLALGPHPSPSPLWEPRQPILGTNACHLRSCLSFPAQRAESGPGGAGWPHPAGAEISWPSPAEIPGCFFTPPKHTTPSFTAFFWHFPTCFFLCYISQGRLPDEQQIIINSSGIRPNTFNPLQTASQAAPPQELPSHHPSPTPPWR